MVNLLKCYVKIKLFINNYLLSFLILTNYYFLLFLFQLE